MTVPDLQWGTVHCRTPPVDRPGRAAPARAQDRDTITPVLPALDHPWDVSPAEARGIQERLRDRVIICPLSADPATVAGIDVSIKARRGAAAVVVLPYPDLEPLNEARAEVPVKFPYIPGLLAFGEGPAVLAARERLATRPDVLVFDAHGLAHARRMGFATHLGLLVNLPSIGCAKTRLVGEFEEPDECKGSWTPLTDGPDVIGAVVRTRDRRPPGLRLRGPQGGC